ncbi:hypothetical protein NIES4074_38940 [Cylindrospermum sp. NIES-4074]|nr:hypothetical protein NIES4074_38940 [Cylindrospermum sp. NIES-4074]
MLGYKLEKQPKLEEYTVFALIQSNINSRFELQMNSSY